MVHRTALGKAVLGAALLLLASSAASAERSRPYDRSEWFDPATATTDDLRRIPVPADYGDHGGKIVLVGGRLFDGTGKSPYPATVVTAGKRILAILTPGSADYPQDAEVIDVSGKTVMPGLIDLHTHLTYVNRFGDPAETSSQSQAAAALRGSERLRYFLESGITSVRDVGSHGMAPFLLKNFVRDGRIPGPRIFAAGQFIVAQGGHGTEGFTLNTSPTYPDAQIVEASGPQGWRDAVRLQFKRGADLIKLSSHYTQEEIDAAVEEAHSLGLRVTVDSESQYIDMAIAAGVDSIEHVMPRSDEAIRLMAQNGIAAVPTVYILDKIIEEDGGGYWGSTSRRFTTSKGLSREMLTRLRKGGVKMGVGTDLITNYYQKMPTPYIEELENFISIGYSPEEALVAATRTNAEILGMDDKLGTLEPGKLADIIVINGNPDQNVRDLANLETVIINGKFQFKDRRLFMPRHEIKE